MVNRDRVSTELLSAIDHRDLVSEYSCQICLHLIQIQSRSHRTSSNGSRLDLIDRFHAHIFAVTVMSSFLSLP